MKRDIPALLSRALLLTLLTLLLMGSAQARVQDLDRIVAVVNDDVILQSDLDHKVRLISVQLTQQGTKLPPERVLQRQVLESLVMERLQLQLAATLGISVDDNSLNQAMGRLAEQNNLSMSDFRAVLERDGFDFARFREDIRAEMIIGRLRQRQVTNQVTVTPQEVDNYLVNEVRTNVDHTQYHLAHILLAVPPSATPEQVQATEKRAREVMAELRGGADFAQLAVSVSQGQQALQGGDLGWRKASEVPTLFAEVVNNLSPGELAGPISSPSGFHIIKLVDVRGDTQHLVNETHVRHILVKPTELLSDDAVRLRLEQLRERIIGGDDFAELARAHSEDPGSAVKGGDLGWVKPGDLVPEFEKVMDDLQSGQVSRPVKTRFGWHIIQVLGHRQQDNTTEYRRTQATEAIRRRKVEEDTQTWLRRLRDEAYVEYRLDEEPDR